MSELLTPDTEFGDMVLIEISRGCPRKCSFCVISECYGRFRTRSVPVILEQVNRGLKWRTRFGLVGANVVDHPHLTEILHAIKEKGGGVALPSLRLDLLDDELIKTISEDTQITITLAPEAGSERLRELIRKPMQQEKIEQIIVDLMQEAQRKIKLYLMVGLPAETKDDVEAIVNMVKKIKHRIISMRKKKPGSPPLVLSINCFVPKPFTPFQWAPMDTVSRLKAKISYIRKSFWHDPYVMVIHDVPKWAMLQCLLARGDRKILFLLQSVLKHGNDWNAGIAHENINTAYYTTRARMQDEIFPWDHLMDETLKSRLWENYLSVYESMQSAKT